MGIEVRVGKEVQDPRVALLELFPSSCVSSSR